FRGRFAAVEPELNSVLFKGLVKLLPGVLGLDHRCIHNCFVFQCLSLPVSVFSRRPSTLQEERRKQLAMVGWPRITEEWSEQWFDNLFKVAHPHVVAVCTDC